jgi:hypothetical protein
VLKAFREYIVSIRAQMFRNCLHDMRKNHSKVYEIQVFIERKFATLLGNFEAFEIIIHFEIEC